MPRKYFHISMLVILLAFPASLFSQGPDKRGHVAGEILVKFRSGVSRQVAKSTHGLFGATTIRRFNRVNVDHVMIPPDWTVEEAIAAYRLDPDVECAEPNYLRHATATPNDTHFDRLWGLHNTGQTGGTEGADIDAPEAWEKQTGSRNVIIAVLDTGADMDHEDLADNIWTNTGEDWVNGSPGNNSSDDDGNGKIDDYYGWDFINNDNNPDDDHVGGYHGTVVTGIIAAKGNNGVGIAGVSWTASIVVLKILNASGSGPISNEIEAINYAINNGVKVINASFGGPDFSQLEYDAIQTAKAAGILFVAAAGNGGDDKVGDDNDVAGESMYPASYDLDNIISVAATDDDDDLAAFSNYGKVSVDVTAPGVLIYSTVANNNYAYESGTSMATPFVSGLAGLVWADDSSLTYSQVKDLILDGVDTKVNLEEKILTGGRINAHNSLGFPRHPSDLAATATSVNQVGLAWTDNSSGETGFKVERKISSEGTYGEIATLEADVASYNDAELSEATTYHYRVRAYSSNGNSVYSNEANDSTYPLAPSALSATSLSGNQVRLSWTDNSSGETGFKVERKAASESSYSEIDTVEANEASYTDSSVSSSTVYYYRVGAYSSSGNSSYSNEASTASGSGTGGGDSGISCFITTATSI